MRILIVDTCYPAFLKAHYTGFPELADEAYGVQWRALMDTFFGTADSYSHNLSACGHSAHEVVVNCAPLQAAWAREHGVDAEAGLDTVLIAQAREFAPDVVYVQHVHYLRDETLAQLRQIAQLLVGQIATEPPSPVRLRSFQLLFTCLPSFVSRFRAHGIRVELLRLAFDERVLDALSASATRPGVGDAVFIGSLGRTQHRRSNGILASAARKAPIDFWGYGGRLWPPWSPIKRRYHGEAWGLDMYRVLHQSRVAVNRHGSIAGPHAVNMRLFEATGVGTLLVTDNATRTDGAFVAGEEIVGYETAGELAERVRYYLDHEDERAEIAAAGQARTLRDHTYRIRMRELAAMLEAAA